MRRHPIKPRKYLRKGEERWRVHVPDDLWQPGDVRDFHFSAEKDAIAKAKQMVDSRGNLAGKFFRLKQDEQAEIMRLWEDKKSGKSITIAKACEQCLAEKKSSLRENSMVAVKCTFKSMSVWFGQKPAIAVTPDDIKTWLQSYAEWSAKTKLNNLKYASSLFVWCINNQILSYNPCKGVIRPAVPFRAVKILTVSSIRKLFKTCQENDRAMLGFLSLVTFGGLRVMEARRCLASNLTKGKIDLGGESCKLNDRRCLDISPQLGAWLTEWQSDGQLYGTVEVPCFSKRLKSLVRLSGVVLPRNGLRHSFCSYSLELLGADATARAANNSPTMLYKHYVSQVTAADAKEFATILPETACKKTETFDNQPTQP